MTAAGRLCEAEGSADDPHSTGPTIICGAAGARGQRRCGGRSGKKEKEAGAEAR